MSTSPQWGGDGGREGGVGSEVRLTVKQGEGGRVVSVWSACGQRLFHPEWTRVLLSMTLNKAGKASKFRFTDLSVSGQHPQRSTTMEGILP
ncbi:hypothetical protein EYF80_065593 [Liparis tanakae]|uniref:Uncharacterized protein n=1 Tax=Liparis tanakae TaxID=230148 RepID=A0A4Z2E6K6_9TELE|nr:hypothetical protein EYF80_065593 [Liparis tanakae]